MTQDRTRQKTELTEGHDQAELERLRELLNAPVSDQVSILSERLDNPQRRAEDVAAILPQAVSHQDDKGRGLAKAMAPIVDDAIGVSVRKNPKPVVDALYPIIGPAIRKSISSALQGMLQNFNRALEQSLSVQSIRWRIESMRTGRAFSEIVMMHTLEFQVEEVFLIHRATGLLLLHETFDQMQESADRDLVSGMLTAIKDFVKDSFSSEDHDELETFRVGQLTVLVEQSPDAILAVAVRGAPPERLKQLLEDALEQIHLNHAVDLSRFSGDSSVFEVSRPILQDCLVRQFQEKQKKFSPLFWVVTLLAACFLLYWAACSFSERQDRQELVASIKQQPGIIVTSAKSPGGILVLEGLRDPLAGDPEALLQQSPLDPEEVRFAFSPYLSLDPEIVELRVQRQLPPPPEGTVRVENGVLIAEGKLPVSWLIEAQQASKLLPGVTGLKAAPDTVLAAIEKIENQTILFAIGQDQLVLAQEEYLQTINEGLYQIDLIARHFGDRFEVEINGHTDRTGNPEFNQRLSQKRADAIKAVFMDRDYRQVTFRAIGQGSMNTEEMQTDPSAMCCTFNVSWNPSSLWLRQEAE